MSITLTSLTIHGQFAKSNTYSISINCAMEMQDAGVHALSNVCHVDIQRTSKRKPGEVVRILHKPKLYTNRDIYLLILSL